MEFRTLVETSALAAHLSDPALVVVDCRSKLDDHSWGEQQFKAAHIPGAVYAHLERDLSGPKTGTNGRHPLPGPALLARTFGRFGINASRQVVAYDQDNGMYASRLWWLLRWLGHDRVAVLDGGFAKWTAEGRPVAAGEEHREPAEFVPKLRASDTVSVEEISSTAAPSLWRLVDARAPERFRGEIEPIDRVAGHIPSAVNHPFQTNLNADGTFLGADQLRAKWSGTVGDTPIDRLVCYCGSGVTACHDLLALEHAGFGRARLYPGSWSEYSSDPSRPIERSSAEPLQKERR